MKLPAQFLNHSCDPNVVVGGGANDVGSYDFVALRDIDAGEVRECIVILVHCTTYMLLLMPSAFNTE